MALNGQSILVTLDGSSTGEVVLPWAVLFARTLGLRLSLLTVLPDGSDQRENAVSAQARAAGHYLIGVAASLREEGITPDILTRQIDSSIAATIDAVAGETGAALILIATHGYSGFDRWMMGSVADAVVRTATCPVLLIRADPDAPATPPAVSRVLVPLDGFGLAEAAIPVAADLARPFDATVDLVHVVPGFWSAAAALSDTIERQLGDAAGVYLQRCLEEFGAGVRMESHIRRGSPAATLLDYQEETGADLVVMSTHGHSGIKRWALGSVADRIVRSSERPVLLVRPGELPDSARSLF